MKPRVRDAVARTRLFRILDRAAARPVTWVAGPPGAGKTVLVASYVAARRLRGLWYRMDAGDADAAVFLGYVRRAAPGHARRRLRDRGTSAAGAREFFRELYASLKPPFTLVFDDYHEVPAHSPVHRLMQAVVAELPPRGRIIVISRAAPPDEFARLGAARAIVEVGWPELRLTQSESRQLVERLRPAAPPRECARLYTRSDGWAAGLVLMTQEPRIDQERRRIPDSIAGYFAHEVFGRADTETRQVLLETAFLPRVTGAMAEELTGLPAARGVLARLARDSVFTTQHATPLAVYDYHPLFRAFLLRRAHAAFAPERRADVRRRAAVLLSRAGQLEEAARLLVDAAAWDLLEELVETHAATLLAQGRGATVEAWIAALPSAVVERTPWLFYWRAACRLGAAPAATRADAERALAGFRAVDDATGTFLSWTLAVETFAMEQHDARPLDEWIALFDDLVRQFPFFPSTAVETRVACAMLAALALRQPHHREVKLWAARALAVSEVAEDVGLRMHALSWVLGYRLWTGDFDNARPLAAELRVLAGSPAAPPLARILAGFFVGRLAWLTASFPAARAAVDEALALARTSGIGALDGLLACEAAVAALSAGDRAAAHPWLQHLGRNPTALSRFDRAYHQFLVGWDALLVGSHTVALGAHEAVQALTWESGLPAMQALAHFFSALALHAAELPGAEAHVAHGLEVARQIDSRLLEYMGLLIDAAVAARRGDEARSLESLARAMMLGRQHGYRNHWMWWPEMMADLAARALIADIEPDYVRGLVVERGLVPREPPMEVEQWPWPVKVFTLGRFEVVRDGRPVRFAGKAQRKPLALLQVLVALGGQGVREERLMEALWPDAEGDAAHQALSTTLHRLRRLIGYDRALVRQEGRISLMTEHCWVDVWALDRLIARAETAMGRQPVPAAEWNTAVRATERALALYHGDFLSAAPDVSPAAGLAERLRDRLLRLLRRVGQLSEDRGDWEAAVGCYEGALTIHESAEEFYRRLMLAYQRLDRRADAIIAYQRCRKSLASTLGIVPSAETESIYRALQDPGC